VPDLSARDRQLARRRARVRRLHEEGRSIRQIADILDCGRNTVERDLRALRQMKVVGEPERDAAGRFTSGPPLAGAEPGNERALKHGVHSEHRLAPVRERHARELAERYSWIDPGRRALQAQRLAQIELGAAWLDGQDGVVRDDDGVVFDVANKVASWSTQAEAWFAQAEAERREARRFDVLAEVMQDDEEPTGDAA
jgi:DNA-binding CsgD family transcriptional regulator